jgi:hypothetical protein
MYIALLDGPFIVVTLPVPYPFLSPLGPLAWLQGVPGSLSTPLASSLCVAAPSRSIWRLFGSTRARVSPGLGLALALWLGYVFPLRAECLFAFQPHLLTNPPIFWRTVSPLASPHACMVGTCLSGRHPEYLPPVHWQLLHVQPLSSILLGLVPMSPCGLSHRTPFQHHLPLHLRGCPHLVWVVPLPLTAGPRGMPR